MTSPSDEYAAAAAEHGECTIRGDPTAGKSAYARMMRALRELRAEPDRGESALSKLLDHPDESVQVWAATHLLPLSEKPACLVLERVASGPTNLIQFGAKMVLKEWAAGRLRSLL